MAIVRARRDSGQITLTASADGLAAGSVTIDAVPAGAVGEVTTKHEDTKGSKHEEFRLALRGCRAGE